MFVSTCHISLCLVAKSAKYTHLYNCSQCTLNPPLWLQLVSPPPHVTCVVRLFPSSSKEVDHKPDRDYSSIQCKICCIFLIWAIFWLQCNGLHVCNLWNRRVRRHRLVRQWNCEFLMESKSFTFILLIKAPTITIHQMIHPVTKPKYVLLAWLMIMFEANSNWMLWRQQAVRFRGVVLNVDTELCGFN